MNTVTLGRSGLRVSALGFGAWPLAGPHRNLGIEIGWTPCDRKEGIHAVRRALELGVTLFDSCSAYGRADQVVAAALRGAGRSSFTLVSKVGYVGHDGKNPYERRAVEAEVHAALRAHRTTYLDVLQFHHLHFGARDEFLDDAIETFSRLRDAGKIRFIGARIGHLPTFLGPRRRAGLRFARQDWKRLRTIDPDLLHVKHNFFVDPRGDGQQALRRFARSRNLGMLVNKPLAQGLVFSARGARFSFPAGDHRRRKPEFRRGFRRALGAELARVHAAHDAAQIVAACVTYAQSAHANTCVLIGTRTASQADQNFRTHAAVSRLAADALARRYRRAFRNARLTLGVDLDV